MATVNKKEIKTEDELVPALKVTKLSKRYGRAKYAVKDISFEVLPGQFHGFIGANGAGKTTAIKSIIGAYAKYEGKVEIFGKINKTIAAKKHLGYIPETAKFPAKMTTFKYLSYMAYLSGYTKKEADKFATEKIIELGLQKVSKRSPNSFSSGQKKKVLLAQALIGDPDIIIMDEPAANLDPMARVDFFQNLKKIQKEGKSILISSHILTELDTFVDSVTIIDGGVLAYTGTIAALDNKTIREFIFAFMDKKSDEIFKEYLTKNKIKFIIKHKRIYAMMKTQANLNKALEFIKKKNLPVDRIQRNKLNLPQIYDKFVIKGSVATGTGRETKTVAKKGGK